MAVWCPSHGWSSPPFISRHALSPCGLAPRTGHRLLFTMLDPFGHPSWVTSTIHRTTKKKPRKRALHSAPQYVCGSEYTGVIVRAYALRCNFFGMLSLYRKSWPPSVKRLTLDHGALWRFTAPCVRRHVSCPSAVLATRSPAGRSYLPFWAPRRTSTCAARSRVRPAPR